MVSSTDYRVSDAAREAVDALVEATNGVPGGGVEGYKWAVLALLEQAAADHGGRAVARLMADLGWVEKE